MKIKKVLVIPKRSALERVFQQKKLPQNAPVLKTLRTTAREHVDTLKQVRNVLARRGIEATLIKRTSLDLDILFHDYDLVITVGGDGTLLNVSHYLSDTPILGVISSQTTSIGVLCGANRTDFDEKIEGIIEGGIEQVELQRIQVCINGLPIPIPALNDVLFANQFPAATTRYVLTYKNRSEEQKSSGIWIATAAGSTAASMSAGGPVLPIGSSKLAFVVREPFFNNKGRHITKGILKPGDKFGILSTTIGGVIFIDGQPPEFSVRFNQTISVSLHQHPIRIFGYDETRRKAIIASNS